MSSLISSNFGYYVLKLVEKNLDVYKPMVESNLLVPFSKTSAKRKALLLTT